MTISERGRATLVLGGARSGKSRFAETLAERSGLEKVYVATGAAYDSEMAERIACHQRQRGHGWTTVEDQLELPETIVRESRAGRIVLVDCLTLWLSNLIFADRDPASATARLCEVIGGPTGPCVFVSNEVGMGIVPENRLARSFRDAQGRLNQHMAEVCDQVVFVAAGLPLVLKPNTQPDIQS